MKFNITNITCTLSLFLVGVPGTAMAAEIESVFFDQIKLVKQHTGYGKGEAYCPAGFLALGGGSHCSNGDLDVSYPIVAGNLPVGWAEWHRGASSNDCSVYAICAPQSWFSTGQIKVEMKETGYGQGHVNCKSGPNGDFVAISGGSFCSDGDLDVSFPASTGRFNRTWKEWHRGASSNDCKVYAICVDDGHWVAKQSRIVSNSTGYGQGAVWCEGDIAIGGGSYCRDGDFDVSFPESDLSGWREWHRGASSNDCQVYATCLQLEKPVVGESCGTDAVYDCRGYCTSFEQLYSRYGGPTCDDGRNAIDLNCQAFDFDGGACRR